MEEAMVFYIIFGITILTCVFGWVGNGHIIWLLGFHLKKSNFSTYILNLAVADLGTVAFLSIFLIVAAVHSFYESSGIFLYNLFVATYTAGLCFLATISTERCLSLFFPCWYRCHRPKCLSSRLSFIIWTLSGMFCGMRISFYLVYGVPISRVVRIMFIVNFWILPSLVAICTVVLLTKLGCRYQQHPLGSLNIIIILMLLFFLIFGIPCILVNSLFRLGNNPLVFAFSHLFFSANSSIKPMFYYLVGKQWKWHSGESLSVELQRVFQDEGNSTGSGELMSANGAAEEACNIQTASSS